MPCTVSISAPDVSVSPTPLVNGLVTVVVHVEGSSDILDVTAEAYAAGDPVPDPPQYELSPVRGVVGDYTGDIPAFCADFNLVAQATFANPSDPMGPEIIASQSVGIYTGDCSNGEERGRQCSPKSHPLLRLWKLLGLSKREYIRWMGLHRGTLTEAMNVGELEREIERLAALRDKRQQEKPSPGEGA